MAGVLAGEGARRGPQPQHGDGHHVGVGTREHEQGFLSHTAAPTGLPLNVSLDIHLQRLDRRSSQQLPHSCKLLTTGHCPGKEKNFYLSFFFTEYRPCRTLASQVVVTGCMSCVDVGL